MSDDDARAAEWEARIAVRMEQSMPSWREVGVDNPLTAYELEKWGIGPHTYAKAVAEGLESLDEIVGRYGGP